MPFLLTNIAGIYKGTGKGGKKLSTRMNELVDNFLSKTKAESEFGAIDDPSTYDYLIKTLEPFIYDETVDNKRNDLIAAKNQLQTTLDNAIQNKTYIEVNLNDGL